MNSFNSHKPSCQDEIDESALRIVDALKIIREQIQPVRGIHNVPLRSALGHVLAQSVVSPVNVPAYRNSAMDGYALDGSQLPATGNLELEIVGTAWAGVPFRGSIGPSHCVRIMTGAIMPEETDTVVIQERVEQIDGRIRIEVGNIQGQNVRQAGEDITRGETVLETGARISPAQLGLLASLGIAEVPIYRRIRVAFFSSGDELRSIGEPLEKGQIYDSNRYTLYGMLTEIGAEVIDMGVIQDDKDLLCEALAEAAEQADLVLTTGGVSVGEADYIKEAVKQLGELSFTKLAVKPGRPLTFGRINDALFFGLPGNPVAVMVGFYQIVRPALKRMIGEQSEAVPTITVNCASKIRKSPNRNEFPRGLLGLDAKGQLSVRSCGRQGSGVLSSMSDANCFILLPYDGQSVNVGDSVEVQLFDLLRW